MSEVMLQLRDVLGRTLTLTDPYIVKEWSGFGLSPVSHITEAGVYQDGETFRDARREARTLLIALDIVADSRQELWEYRGNLTKMLAWLTGGCYVVVMLPDGPKREILARYVGQADMGRKEGDGPVRQRVVLNLRCEDPAFFDPTETIWDFNVAAGLGDWSYPLGFPAGFMRSTIDDTGDMTYPGSLPAYPIITIEGPAEQVFIENQTTDEQLDLATKGYTMVEGETVTIDTRPRHKGVTSSVNGNIIDYLSDDSDLGTFHIAPDPESEDGTNTIYVYLEDGNPNTRVRFRFNDRYDGVHL